MSNHKYILLLFQNTNFIIPYIFLDTLIQVLITIIICIIITSNVLRKKNVYSQPLILCYLINSH